MVAWLCVDKQPRSGAENMAIDSALLERVQHVPESVLRIYRWEQPTVSLGYFQDPATAEVPESCARCPRVGRLSGGGAILHDREWTYSFVLPAGHPQGKEPVRLYPLIHHALIRHLADCGVTATLRGHGNSAEEDRRIFLCFLRGDANDVVIGSGKVIGSAQRRRRGAVLQHGSILAEASRLLPQVPGIAELSRASGRQFDATRFQAGLPRAVAAVLDGDWRFCPVSELVPAGESPGES